MVSLDLIRTFVAYVETGHVSRAARGLGLSQAAVTGHLQRLEESLPCPPFITRGRRKSITPYGQALYEELQGALVGCERAIERVNRRFADPANLTLRVGARRELLTRLAPLSAFPGNLELVALGGEDLLESLVTHRIDVAITHRRGEGGNFVVQPFFKEGAKLVVHKQLAGKRRSLGECRAAAFAAGVPCIAYKKDPPYLGEWARHCGLAANGLRVKVVCEDWLAVMALVEAGVGYSIVPAGIPSRSSAVFAWDVPADVIPEMTFYAMHHRELGEVRGFVEALAQL